MKIKKEHLNNIINAWIDNYMIPQYEDPKIKWGIRAFLNLNPNMINSIIPLFNSIEDKGGYLDYDKINKALVDALSVVDGNLHVTFFQLGNIVIDWRFDAQDFNNMYEIAKQFAIAEVPTNAVTPQVGVNTNIKVGV